MHTNKLHEPCWGGGSCADHWKWGWQSSRTGDITLGLGQCQGLVLHTLHGNLLGVLCWARCHVGTCVLLWAGCSSSSHGYLQPHCSGVAEGRGTSSCW